MGKASRKPRKRIDVREVEFFEKQGKREPDWTFADIVRSKHRGR